MLTEIEFMDKRHIVLDKFDTTYIMNRDGENWEIFEIRKSGNRNPFIQSIGLTGDEAYSFYRERMESFGFKPFPIIEE